GLAGSRGDLWRTLASIARHFEGIHVPSLAFGLVAFIVLQVGHALRPRWPTPLIVVSVSLAVMEIPALQAWNIASVGTFPAGIPWPAIPNLHWHELSTLMPLSLRGFFLAYNEGIAAARVLALRHDYAIDPNRELVALGVANIAIAVGRGFP